MRRGILRLCGVVRVALGAAVLAALIPGLVRPGLTRPGLARPGLLLAAPNPDAAGQAAPAPLSAIRTLRCTFTLFVATHWVDGEPETVAGEDQFTFSIEGIDAQARRAQIVGTTATASASAFMTETGLNVIEQTPIGNFILTTVFSSGRTGDRFMAVHSRHLGDVAAPPGPSQYFGSCEAAPAAD